MMPHGSMLLYEYFVERGLKDVPEHLTRTDIQQLYDAHIEATRSPSMELNVYVIDTPKGKQGFLTLFDVAVFCSIINIVTDVKVVGYSNTKGYGYWTNVDEAVKEYRKDE